MSAIETQVWRSVVDHAHEAYLQPIRPSSTMPIDRRCPSCGVERDGCESATCIRAAA
jgi:hypothetical protein